MRRLIAVAAIALLATGCTAAQVAKVNATGQLYCAKATADGPLIVALVNATAGSGAVIATGATSAYVNAACAAWSATAVPVTPPTVAVPTVAIATPSTL